MALLMLLLLDLLLCIDLRADQLHGGTSTQPQMVESSMNTPLWSGSNGYQTSTSNLMSKQFNVDGPKEFDQVVLDCLQQSSSTGQEKGMQMDELSQKLKLPMEKIKESIRSLEDEGLIYSTMMSFTTKQPDEVHGIGNATQKRHLGHNGSRNSLYDGVYGVQEFHWARIVSATHRMMNVVASYFLFLVVSPEISSDICFSLILDVA
ncbi:uncharacterized protein LOC133674401 [Populus nigra]|uniref:uncharacterized protein LOC133674401 n=1 Tax=Populus nigra TaxID=3691 RepID=UPI002B278EB3|nr:uncharacterized protein LOC133674401 [Populus nigra]